MTPTSERWVFLMTIVVTSQVILKGAGETGINFGMLGNNLPSASDAINLIKNSNIPLVRFFAPHSEVLDALRGSKINVSVGTKNEDLANLANNPSAADDWVTTNIVPYNDVQIKYVTAGNEVIPGDIGQYVLQAMQNLEAALEKAGLGQIIVTTVVPASVLGTSYPPSAGAFANNVAQTMTDIANHLHSKGYPLMINVYPYFALVSDPDHITQDFALFKSAAPVFTDNDHDYYNLFDSMVDAFRAALTKATGAGVGVVISETGWPSAGNPPYTTVENAQAYNSNLKSHVQNGTPAKPDELLEVFIFALFNENQKPEGVEQNFGCFQPDMTPVYNLWS